MEIDKTKFYQKVFLEAKDAIFLLNKENVFVECNPITLQMFGCTKQDIIGHTPLDLSPEVQLDGRLSKELAIEKMTNAFAGNPQLFEWIHLRKDRTPFFAQVSLSKIDIENEEYLLAIVRDNTESFLKRELGELFNKLIEHDIRNSAVSILGMGDLIKNELGESSTFKHFLERIKKRSSIILTSIDYYNQVRDIFEKRQVSDVNLTHIIKEAIRREEQLKEKDVEVIFKPEKEAFIYGTDFLSIVIANLIRNAYQHGGATKIYITLEDDKSSQNVVVLIEDNGKGLDETDVSEESFSKIFEKNYKGAHSLGSGLGLFLAKRVITLLDGTITASKSAYGGLKFVITLKKVQRKNE